MRKQLFYNLIILLFVTVPVRAVGTPTPTTDYFHIELYDDNQFSDGWGSGYWNYMHLGESGTEWYYYDSDWHSQWFYDGPPDSDKSTLVTYDIDIDGVGEVTIGINWSTMDFPESGSEGPPPIPPMTEEQEFLYIGRQIIYENTLDADFDNDHISGTFIIPSLHPEWVSIDARLYSYSGATIDGTITFETIPAPGAIILSSIGVGFVGWLRKRRTI